MTIATRQATIDDLDVLVGLRSLLWPRCAPEEHRAELEGIFLGTLSCMPLTTILATYAQRTVGFVEVGLRSHADGCDPRRPVGYIEGWFVLEDVRGMGIGGRLIDDAAAWAARYGCRELASDTWADSELSLAAHRALGFEAVDRCVNFRRSIEAPPGARHTRTILVVEELEPCVSFYRDVFTLPVIVDAPNYVELSFMGQQLGLYRRAALSSVVGQEIEAPRGSRGTELYLESADFDLHVERLRERAREISPPAIRPWGDEVAYFEDPVGNILAIARR